MNGQRRLNRDWPLHRPVPSTGRHEQRDDDRADEGQERECVFVSAPHQRLGEDIDRRRALTRRYRERLRDVPNLIVPYDELGVEARPYVTTIVDRARIRAYWNTGMVAARRSEGLFGEWERALIRLFEGPQQTAEIAGPEWVTIRQVGEEVARQLGVEFEPGSKTGSEVMIDPRELLPDWQPQVSLREGIGRVIADARAYLPVASSALR